MKKRKNNWRIINFTFKVDNRQNKIVIYFKIHSEPMITELL